MPPTRTSEAYQCDQCGGSFHPFNTAPAKRFCSRQCSADWAKARPIAERFNQKLVKLPSGCWYIGSGHDRMYAKIFHDGKQLHGHRISWMIHRGAIPDGLCVCHNCPGGDNRWCVNPDHLFLGTLQDNNRDTAKKGRYAMFSNAKLNPIHVRAIRKDFKNGTTRKELASRYGVALVTIKRIISLRAWKQVLA